jgi:histidinol dehydrogenase
MIEIFDVDKARQTILRREPLFTRDYPPAVMAGTERIFGPGVTPVEAVNRILVSVREQGDIALRDWTRKLDNSELVDFALPPDALSEALANTPEELGAVLRLAEERIRIFHQKQPLPSWETDSLGGTLGQRFTPIQSVGVYVPGGTAPLPSSLLMSVIPAQVAGVERIVVCTPPEPHPSILAAACLCGIDEVFQIGGAQAIAALAFGTESVPRVDKIVGAGNLFVTLAKQQVYGWVGLDGLAGPTETMVIADDHANPRWVAADLLAQAEHDILASAILLTPSLLLAEAVQDAVAHQIESLSRAEIIAQSLSSKSGIVITPDLDTACRLASEYAPEHLCLSVGDPEIRMAKIRNAGGVFRGEGCCVVLGDYVAGPSHIMPTGGTARFASPLNVLDFVKISSIIALDGVTSQALSPLAARFAQEEGLTAHAAAAYSRQGGQGV